MGETRKAFGVLHEGDLVRIAVLSMTDKRVTIEKLLSEQILTSGKGRAHKPSSMSGAYDYDASEKSKGFSLDSSDSDLEFEELETAKDVFAPSNIEALTNLSQEAGLREGAIAINLEVSNVRYRKVDVSTSRPKRIVGEVREYFRSQGIDPQSSFGYIPLRYEDNQVMGICHEGRMEILENLVAVNQITYRNSLVFANVCPNEIALVNAVRFNYEISDDEYSAIFYIGADHSRITLMKGHDFYMELPLINEGSSSSNILNKVYSRFLLEKSQREVPELSRIFLAGDQMDRDALEDIQKREPSSSVEILLPLFITEGEVYQEKFSTTDIAAYIIPITLAMMLFFPDNPQMLTPNFLPKELKPQSQFAMGIPGILFLILTSVIILYSVSNYFAMRSQNEILQSEIQGLQAQMGTTQSLTDSINAMEARIVDLQNRIAREKSLIGNKNQWHNLLETASQTMSANGFTWLTNIHLEKEEFKITGNTTSRQAIIPVSQMYGGLGVPFGRIEKVDEKEIEDQEVWTYEILYKMTDPLLSKRSDYQRGLFLGDVRKTHPDAMDATAKEVHSNQASVVMTPEKQTKPVSSGKPDKPQSAPAKKPPDSASGALAKPGKEPVKPGTKAEDQITGDFPGKTVYTSALDLYYANRYQEAIAKFTEFRAKYPGKWAVHALYFIGECRFQTRDYKGARQAFEEVLTANSAKKAESVYMLGRVSEQTGQSAEAKKYWQTVVNDYPKSSVAGKARQKLGSAGGNS